MVKPLMHPKAIAALANFFPQLVTIQEGGAGRNAMGEEVLTWADKAGHVALPAAIAPFKGNEVKRRDGTIAIATFKIALSGNYPAITAKMRAVAGGVTYDILVPQIDSQGQVTTLLCEVVT